MVERHLAKVDTAVRFRSSAPSYSKPHSYAVLFCSGQLLDNFFVLFVQFVQTTKYEKKHNKITQENYAEYLTVLMAECKAKLDRLEISKENISAISAYAVRSYKYGKYDEVEAEYEIKKALEKR